MAFRKSIQWSSTPLSTQEFIDNHGNSLPLVVMVTKGYYGEDDIDTLASNQVLRIQSIDRQKRVIATDNRGRTLSIPEDYPIKFEILPENRKKKSGKTKRLSEIISAGSKLTFPLPVEFERKRRWTFRIGSHRYSSSNYGKLVLEREHWQTFIKAHTIHDGRLDNKTVLIPSYLDIRLCVALGYREGTLQEWYSDVSVFNRNIDSRKLNSYKGSKNIILHKEKSTRNETVHQDLNNNTLRSERSSNLGQVPKVKAASKVTKVTKVNSMDRYQYQNNNINQGPGRRPGANWTKVMQVDGIDHRQTLTSSSRGGYHPNRSTGNQNFSSGAQGPNSGVQDLRAGTHDLRGGAQDLRGGAQYSNMVGGGGGQYASKIRVKQDEISSETSSLSFDSNVPLGNNAVHVSMGRSGRSGGTTGGPTGGLAGGGVVFTGGGGVQGPGSGVYSPPGRTHIYQRNKRVGEAPARYQPHHHNAHVINIPLRRSVSAENFHDLSYTSPPGSSVVSDREFWGPDGPAPDGSYHTLSPGGRYRTGYGMKLNTPVDYHTLPSARSYSNLHSPKHAPVITHVHSQTVTSGRGSTTLPAQFSPGPPMGGGGIGGVWDVNQPNATRSHSHSYSDDVFLSNTLSRNPPPDLNILTHTHHPEPYSHHSGASTLPLPQKSYYIRRAGLDSSRSVARQSPAPVILHSPTQTITSHHNRVIVKLDR